MRPRYPRGARSAAPFGLVLAPGGKGVFYVDDGENSLQLRH
jgi:hypothetical protein